MIAKKGKSRATPAGALNSAEPSETEGFITPPSTSSPELPLRQPKSTSATQSSRAFNHSNTPKVYEALSSSHNNRLSNAGVRSRSHNGRGDTRASSREARIAREEGCTPREATEEHTGTFLSSCINISNTILGSGMLAMPAALAAVGLAPGIFFILFSACASSFGLILLAKTAAHVGRTSSFNSCSKITYPDAAVWFDAAIAIKCFGVSISYLLICGELFPKVIHGFYPNLSPDSVLSTKFFWVTLSMFVVGPFCFLPRLDSLRYTSAFALLAVVYLIFIVVSYFADPLAPGMPARPGAGDIRWWNLNSQVFSQLPIFVFAFTCHQNIFAVYNELDDNAYPRVRGVITTSIGGAFSIYELVGILGYLTFGNGISSNIITEYPPTPFIMGGQLAYTILVLLSYPLQCHPCRASLDKVLGHISDRITPPDELTRARRRAHEISWPKWLGMTLGIMAGSYVVAIFVDDLGKVLAYVGATGSTTICYILPGLFYTKLCSNIDANLIPPTTSSPSSEQLLGRSSISSDPAIDSEAEDEEEQLKLGTGAHSTASPRPGAFPPFSTASTTSPSSSTSNPTGSKPKWDATRVGAVCLTGFGVVVMTFSLVTLAFGGGTGEGQ